MFIASLLRTQTFQELVLYDGKRLLSVIPTPQLVARRSSSESGYRLIPPSTGYYYILHNSETSFLQSMRKRFEIAVYEKSSS